MRSALLRFYDRNAANDQAAFPSIVSADPDLLVIGSAAREWFIGPDQVRGAYGIEGFRIDAGSVRAYERGELGYAVNTPRFVAPERRRPPSPHDHRLRQGGRCVEAPPYARFHAGAGRGGDGAPGRLVGRVSRPSLGPQRAGRRRPPYGIVGDRGHLLGDRMVPGHRLERSHDRRDLLRPEPFDVLEGPVGRPARAAARCRIRQAAPQPSR